MFVLRLDDDRTRDFIASAIPPGTRAIIFTVRPDATIGDPSETKQSIRRALDEAGLADLKFCVFQGLDVVAVTDLPTTCKPDTPVDVSFSGQSDGWQSKTSRTLKS